MYLNEIYIVSKPDILLQAKVFLVGFYFLHLLMCFIVQNAAKSKISFIFQFQKVVQNSLHTNKLEILLSYLFLVMQVILFFKIM